MFIRVCYLVCAQILIGCFALAQGVNSVQQRLNGGESPLSIYKSNPGLLDSLYGKTYAGGLIYYLDTLTGSGRVCADEDETGNAIQLSNLQNMTTVAGAVWGCNGVQIGGAMGTSIGSGRDNTIAIVNGCPDKTTAAYVCSNLIQNGYSDWYLPAIDELQLMYNNLARRGYGNFIPLANYWSSTQWGWSANFSWTLRFIDGATNQYTKNSSLSVRAARHFIAACDFPSLSTASINVATLTSATGGGDIQCSGGPSIIQRGICWSTSPVPTMNDNLTMDGTGAGSFQSTLSGLIPETTYYVRAYAKNSNSNVFYGNIVNFTITCSYPELSTNAIDSITSTTAISGGMIQCNGGSSITARGICWSTSSQPTINDQRTTNGTGRGQFQSRLNGLKGNTTYYVRAYATNSDTTVYGNTLSFTTKPFVTVTSISPVVDTVGSTITIKGKSFMTGAPAKLINFNGVYADTNSVNVLSDSVLQVTVPYGARFGPISVTANSRTASSMQFFIPTFAGNDTIGDYSFTGVASHFNTGNNPLAVTIGDMNRDGKPDVVTLNNTDATVSVLRNTTVDSTVTFASRNNFPVENNPQGIAIGDLNGDGKLDIVTANGSNATVLRNTTGFGSSTITFANRASFSVGHSAWSVAIADIDGDCKPDVITANRDSVAVLRNTSSGTTISFAPGVHFDVPSSPWSVAIGDLNRDGKPDLVSASTQKIAVLLNTSTEGSISFAYQDTVRTRDEMHTVVMGDLDGDGKLDLVTSDYNFELVSAFENTTSNSGPITFASEITFMVYASSIVYSAAIGDLNGDGKLDLAASTNFGNPISLLRNTTTTGSITSSSFATAVRYALSIGWNGSAYSVALGDLNSDGRPEVVTTTSYNKASVLRNIMRRR